MPLLCSTVIPAHFVHGFATREVDLEAAVAAAGMRLYRARQVHGAEVLEVGPETDPAVVRATDGDIVLTAAPRLAAAVATADCVPILLCAPAHGACAAVHAGLRATALRAVHAGVRALVARTGAAPAELCAVIGPCICPDCYEVGDEVVQQLAPLDGAAVRRGPDGRPHADLRQANRALLLAAGLASTRIGDVAGCTRCDPAARFHSYRRDRERRGSQLAFIGRTV
jgi:hypothetical protein